MNVGVPSPAAASRARWTVLVYSAADNDLKPFMVDDVDEMERVGSDARTNLVVQLDTGDAARRLHLQPDPDPGIRSPEVGNLGPVDMADPATLADFVEWGIKSYPAEHYMLVISDHGDGWKGAVQDDSHGTWMTSDRIREGLEEAQRRTGVKLDVLGFDACNMAAVETAYELRDTAGYMVASEKTEAAEGWPYTRWLNPETLKVFQAPRPAGIELAPADLAKEIVQSAASHNQDIPTLSAVDLGKMEQVGRAVDELGRSILATPTSVWRMKRKVWGTESFEGYKDAYHLAQRVEEDPKIDDPRLKAAARGVMQAVGDAVLAEQHHPSLPDAHGLTLEARTFFNPGGDYGDLALSRDTYWDEAQSQLTRWWTIPRPVD